jgi:flagellar motor switch protein FliN/FliY
VHDEIEFMPLEPAGAGNADGTDLRRLYDVPVELAVEIGRTRMTIGQTLDLRPGSLNRLAGEPVDLLINGKPIARGEVVVIDEEFGLRITDVVAGSRNVEDEATIQAAQAAAAEADLMAHVGGGFGVPDPLGGGAPDPLGGTPAVDPFAGPGPDPLGTPPPDPLGGRTPSVDDISLGEMPAAEPGIG